MSKLAHSNQETMDELDRRRAIRNGDEDLIREEIFKAKQKKEQDERDAEFFTNFGNLYDDKY